MTMLFSKPNDADLRARLKAILIHYRETVLVQKYPRADRKEGILRRAMIDAVLDVRPESVSEFLHMLPEKLLLGTDPNQMSNEIATIVRFVRRT